MDKQIILMRHAEDYGDGERVRVSERDCEMAISTLSHQFTSQEGKVAEALGDGVAILHSDRERARLTAEKVGERFRGRLFESGALGDMSMDHKVHNYPRDFIGFVSDELGEAGVSAWEETGSLLVVTHEPFVAAAASRHGIPHCYPILFDGNEYRAMISLATLQYG